MKLQSRLAYLSSTWVVNLNSYKSSSSMRSNFILYLQFKQAEDTVQKLDLDGLVVIGGDDSNTNACLLAEYFRFLCNDFFFWHNLCPGTRMDSRGSMQSLAFYPLFWLL